MSDERLRELERRWQETGADADEAPFLLEQVRLGRLSRARLELAASLDHPAARLALGDDAPPREPEPSLLARWLRRTEHEVRGRLVGWPSGTAFELSEWVRGVASGGEVIAHEAVRQLARLLSDDWPRLQRAVEAHAHRVEAERSDLVAGAVDCVRVVVETQDPERARERVRAGLAAWAVGRTPPAMVRSADPNLDDDVISRLTVQVLEEARVDGASEVVFEPELREERGHGAVRYPGLNKAMEPGLPPQVFSAVLLRFKYLAGLDLFETEAAQAGQAQVTQGLLTVETYQVEGGEACRVVVR